MQRLAVILLATTLAAGPGLTQTPYEPPAADDPMSGIEDDIESGIQGFMEKLLNDVQPHLDQLGRDLNDTVNSFAPVLDELGDLMDDVGNYQTPERLENGDILIRRRADAPPPPAIGNTLRDLLAPNPDGGTNGDGLGTMPRQDGPAPPPQSLPAPADGTEIEL